MTCLEEKEPMFDLEPIRRKAVDPYRFSPMVTALYLTRLAEDDVFTANPEGYVYEFFDHRYPLAVGEVLSRPSPGERRVRLSRNAAGVLVTQVITPETDKDENDLIMDLYDRLEASHAPILGILDQVRQQRIIQGDEYSLTMKLCLVLAAQGLPPESQ